MHIHKNVASNLTEQTLKKKLNLINKKILVILIIINTFSFAFSQSLEKENLFSFSHTYKTQEKLSVSELDSLIITNKISEIESKANYPVSSDFLWVKFDIPWKKEDKEKVIEVNNPFINDIALYKKTKENTFEKIGYGGDKTHKFYERSYINRRYIFPIKNTLETTTYYLLVDNRKAIMLIPTWVWDKQKFEKNEKKENIFYTIYFSFIFFIGLISLIVSLITKKRLFLHYGLYIWSFWIYLFTTLGFSFQYIYPNNTDITSDTRYFMVSLLIITAINFMISFLKMKHYTKFSSKILRLLQYIFIVFIIIYFINRNLFYIYHTALTYFFRTSYFIVMSVVLIGAYKIRKVEPKRAQLFVTSVFLVILGFTAYIGIQLDIIPHFWFSINPVIIGVGLEIIVLTIALFNILKKVLQKNKVLTREFEILQQELDVIKQEKTNSNKPTEDELINLKSKAILNSSEILYVKSDGHYVEYFLENKTNPEIDRNSLSEILKILPSNSFVRIHKSFIVNIYRIKIINSTKVMLDNGVWINLSRTYKQQLKDILHKED